MRGAQMTERERFERWARRRGYPIERDHSGEYLWSTECRWEGWQARARVRGSKKLKSGNYGA